MNDENKPNGISRVSKLKKRRRPITTNSLGSPDSRETLRTTVSNAKDGVKNVASAGNRSSALRQIVVNRGEVHTISTSNIAAEHSSSEPFKLNFIESSLSAHSYRRQQHPCPNNGASRKTSRSIMGFLDYIDHSELIAAIPSIVGLDMDRYHASNPEFVQAVNQAFSYRVHCRKRHAEFVGTGISGNAFHHPLVGCVDVPTSGGCQSSTYDDRELPLAFPLLTSTETDDTSKPPCLDLDHFDILTTSKRKTSTGGGKRIPLSFCQFPRTHPVMTFVEQKSKESPLEVSPRVFREQKSTQHLHKRQYRGKIRIVSSIGASIREAYDIDKSQHVLGKLETGDERYFLAKKILPPPPNSLDDGDFDECISVVRYKILLETGDTSSGFPPRDEFGRSFGWISNRGRLADDSYLILNEIEC